MLGGARRQTVGRTLGDHDRLAELRTHRATEAFNGIASGKDGEPVSMAGLRPTLHEIPIPDFQLDRHGGRLRARV
jgi:hypothetical protein